MAQSKRGGARAKRKKLVYGNEYQAFLQALRLAREEAGLTQEQVAERLGQGQTYVSRSERGEHRVDIAELFYFCQAYGVGFVEFVRNLESSFKNESEIL